MKVKPIASPWTCYAGEERLLSASRCPKALQMSGEIEVGNGSGFRIPAGMTHMRCAMRCARSAMHFSFLPQLAPRMCKELRMFATTFQCNL